MIVKRHLVIPEPHPKLWDGMEARADRKQARPEWRETSGLARRHQPGRVDPRRDGIVRPVIGAKEAKLFGARPCGQIDGLAGQWNAASKLER